MHLRALTSLPGTKPSRLRIFSSSVSAKLTFNSSEESYGTCNAEAHECTNTVTPPLSTPQRTGKLRLPFASSIARSQLTRSAKTTKPQPRGRPLPLCRNSTQSTIYRRAHVAQSLTMPVFGLTLPYWEKKSLSCSFSVTLRGMLEMYNFGSAPAHSQRSESESIRSTAYPSLQYQASLSRHAHT